MQQFGPFVELKNQMADEWLARLGKNTNPSQIELRMIAQAHIVLEDLPAALAAIERGITLPGPLTQELRGDAEQLGNEIARQKRFSAQKN